MSPSASPRSDSRRKPDATCNHCRETGDTSDTVTPASSLLTVEDLAQRLSVDVSFVRHLVHQRRICYVKIGPYVRFDVGDVVRWIAAQRVVAGSAPPMRSRSAK